MPVFISFFNHVSKNKWYVPYKTQCLTCIESNAVACLLKVDPGWAVIFVQIAVVEGIHSLKNRISRKTHSEKHRSCVTCLHYTISNVDPNSICKLVLHILPGKSFALLLSPFCLADDSNLFSKGVEVKVSARLITFDLNTVGHFSKSLEAVSEPNRSVKS